MSLFFISFILTYGGMHLYAFLKVRAIYPERKKLLIFIALFFLLMISAPFFVRFYEKQGFETFAYLTANVGFLWMGVIYLFFTYGVVIDLYRFFLFLIRRLSGLKLTGLNLSAKTAFLLPLIIAVSVVCYGYFEAMDIQIEHVTIRSPKIPEAADGLKVVQISDVHIGHIIRSERLRNILEKVKSAEPDILVSTGDLIDGDRSEFGSLSEMFNEIKPRYGKFAVTGNHEYYAGIERSMEFTEEAGFKVLRGEAVTIDGLINIAGVDDSTGIRFGDMSSVSEKELLLKLPQDKFTLLLKHRPHIDKESLGLYGLQLSGHTHKGQIFPFNFYIRFFFPYINGLHELTDISSIYVSRGTGTWGPPVRFMSPPEVTVFELVRAI